MTLFIWSYGPQSNINGAKSKKDLQLRPSDLWAMNVQASTKPVTGLDNIMLRARRNKKEMKVKPVTSFKLLTIFIYKKKWDKIQNKRM